MAIRNKKLLDNAFKRIDEKENDKVTITINGLNGVANKLYAHADELTDILDTYNYCVGKGYGRYVKELGYKGETYTTPLTIRYNKEWDCHYLYMRVTDGYKGTTYLMFHDGKFYFVSKTPFEGLGKMSEITKTISRMFIRNKENGKIGAYVDYLGSCNEKHIIKDGVEHTWSYTESTDFDNAMEFFLEYIEDFISKAHNIFDTLG